MSRLATRPIWWIWWIWWICLFVVCVFGAGIVPAAATENPALWSEEERRFLLDGPAWLIPASERRELLELDDEARRNRIEEFLVQDPLPSTPQNELEEGIRRRRELVEEHHLSWLDVRAQLRFLHGEPSTIDVIDCGSVYLPLEIWTYEPGEGSAGGFAVLYQPKPRQPYKLWRPIDSKRALYTSEMQYFLEQWEAFKGQISGQRIDLRFCKEAKDVDRITGVDGLFRYLEDRPAPATYRRLVDPPKDLAQWAERAAATSDSDRLTFEPSEIRVEFPRRQRQRIVARVWLVFDGPGPLEFVSPDPPAPTAATPAPSSDPADSTDPEASTAPATSMTSAESVEVEAGGPDPTAIASASSEDPPLSSAPDEGEMVPEDDLGPDPLEVRLTLEGLTENGDEIFDSFRIRYRPTPEEGQRWAVVFERPLRGDEEFLIRYRLKDEIGGAVSQGAVGFRVPRYATEVEEPEAATDIAVTLGEEMAEKRIAGADSMFLVPPVDDVVLGLWRADVVVTGPRIVKVGFFVDGQRQLTDARLPFTAEVRLAEFPTEQVIRVEGYDSEGTLVSADEILVNRPRGVVGVRILSPGRGQKVQGTTDARAEIVLPEGRTIEEVIFEVDGKEVARLTEPPWVTPFVVPQGGIEQLSYLSVKAVLDDGSEVEDVRFLNAPTYVEEVDVNLVELYTAVFDRNGRPVTGLEKEAFAVAEDGEPRAITRFERVVDLPLVVGIAIDTSGSMASSMFEAQKAAQDFLAAVVRPQDRSFALAFATEPRLLMAPTDDLDGVRSSLSELRADGWTTLHDAIVTGLYYFRGFRGQRVMVVLSDGDDTRSSYAFNDALAFARSSGVAIYTIGLETSPSFFGSGVRRKLSKLAEDTGGRSFFVSQAEELTDVYEEIEAELRNRYLLVFEADSQEPGKVTVDVKGGGLSTRTTRSLVP